MTLARQVSDGAPAVLDYEDYGSYLIQDSDDAVRHEVVRAAREQESMLTLLETASQGRNLLDTGSGAGFFCRAARERGWHVSGVEPSRRLREYCSETMGLSRIWTDVRDVPGSFDVVTMLDVIEHLSPEDSPTILTSIVDRIVPGGFLAGNTPNVSSLNIMLVGSREPVIAPPSHACYFSRQTLDGYLRRFGLHRVELKTRGFNFDYFARRLLERWNFGAAAGTVLTSLIRISGRALGVLSGRVGRGYQIHFIYRKPD